MALISRRTAWLGLALAAPSLAVRRAQAFDGVALDPALAEIVRPLLRDHDVPGMAVAVTRQGRFQVSNFGVASRETKEPVSFGTLFEIGSVSKVFTATLALYAEALGRLSLEEHPGAYMPALRGAPIDQANLLDLGTYAAGGLPQQFPDAISNEREVEAYFRAWKPEAPPGTSRRYSNPSLGLFGHLTALAMKRPFAELMERELFPGLGLSRAFIDVPRRLLEAYAWGYDGERPVRVSAGPFGGEAYGVKAAVVELIRFVEMNIRPEVHEGAIRKAIEGTQLGHFDIGSMVQGLGWEQYPYPVSLDRLLAGNSSRMAQEPQPAKRLSPPRVPSEPTLFNKTGSTRGFGAYVAFVPARRIGVVLLANRNIPIPARIRAAHAMLEQLDRKGGP